MRTKLKLYVLKLRINILKLFVNKKYNVAIITSLNTKDNLMENNLLIYSLLKNNVNVKVLCYEEENDYTKYDAVVIRTIWGYHDNIDLFNKFLSNLRNNNIKVFNNLELITDNYDKLKQYNILNDAKMPVINTEFVNSSNLNDLNNYSNKMVIKPVISASGKNITIVSKNEDIKSIINTSYKENTELMLQPFLEGAKNGEYSLVYIDGKFKYATLRDSGVITGLKKVTLLNEVDSKLVEVGNSISKLYKNYLFLRIDFIKDNDKYYCLETELLDPSLYLNVFSNFKKKALNADILAKAIISRIK